MGIRFCPVGFWCFANHVRQGPTVGCFLLFVRGVMPSSGYQSISLWPK